MLDHLRSLLSSGDTEGDDSDSDTGTGNSLGDGSDSPGKERETSIGGLKSSCTEAYEVDDVPGYENEINDTSTVRWASSENRSPEEVGCEVRPDGWAVKVCIEGETYIPWTGLDKEEAFDKATEVMREGVVRQDGDAEEESVDELEKEVDFSDDIEDKVDKVMDDPAVQDLMEEFG